MCTEEAVLRLSLLVEHREQDAGEFRVLAVKEAVRGKVNIAVLVELCARCCRAVGREVECLFA